MTRNPLGSTGPEVPEGGFGASPLGAVHGDLSQADATDTVRTALDPGITFFDVSPPYGATRAETVLGKAAHGADRSGYVPATMRCHDVLAPVRDVEGESGRPRECVQAGDGRE